MNTRHGNKLNYWVRVGTRQQRNQKSILGLFLVRKYFLVLSKIDSCLILGKKIFSCFK